MGLVRREEYKKDLDSYSATVSGWPCFAHSARRETFSSVGEKFPSPGLDQCRASLDCNHIENVPPGVGSVRTSTSLVFYINFLFRLYCFSFISPLSPL